MKYGYFDNENKEYVITNPKTPVKWINYVGTLAFGGFVDQTGGALLCKGDPALNRITKYIPQLPASSFNGSSLYVRVRGAKGYEFYSPYFTPSLQELDFFECRVGLGYSKFVSEFAGLRVESRVFVPMGASVFLNDIKVINTNDTELQVDVIPLVEYTHHDALKQYNNADWVPQTMQSRADKDGEFTILRQYSFYMKNRAENFISSNAPVASFESDRNRFLGDNSYTTWQNPLALRKQNLSNYEALRGDNIGALLHSLGYLKKDESRRIIFQLGQEKNIKEILRVSRKFRDEAIVDAEFARLGEFWNEHLDSMQVQTPDADMDTALNIFNPYQCFTTYNWSRYLSLYQLGLGARGIGFRDSSQDTLGIMDRKPELAANLIEKLLMTQCRDGSAMHSFYPSTMLAGHGESDEFEDRPKYYGDDHLWVILSVCEYLKESGDYAFLQKKIAFYEKDKNDLPLEDGTVFEHLKRAIDFTKNHLGKHKMPLLGFADWNDCVNLRAGAESLFIANQYGLALLEMLALCEHLGEEKLCEKYRRYYEEMKRDFNKCAWDGEWFVRYFDFDGVPLGSKQNETGKIYLNGQSWPVISGFASEEKAKRAMDSVYKILNTKYGIKLSDPGYDGYDENIGGVTTYPPGAKENGGIFLHPNPWAMIAETKLGRGDRAYEYYRQINPIAKNDEIDIYEIEPYVYAQNILSKEHPQSGLGRNSWLSGTSAWTYVAGTKFILGIRPAHDGLIIDPCIPNSWEGFRVKRKFRGADFSINVKNPNSSSKGVAKLVVNGESIAGNLIKISSNIKKYQVEATLI